MNCKNTKVKKEIQLSVLSIRALSILSLHYLRRHPYSVSRLRTVCVLPIRTHLRTVDFAGFRIRTVYVLSPYYIRTLYADSADVCTLIWLADRERTPWTDYGGWRRQYGESTEPVRNDFIRSVRSIRET